METWHKFRLSLIFLLFLAFFSLIGFRLVQLQVLPNEDLAILSKRQFNRQATTLPYRHPIVDRNGEELAVTSAAGSVFARPKEIRARKKTAATLSKLLGGTTAKWLGKLDRKKSFVWIQRQVSPEVAKKVAELKLSGIYIESAHRRLYPNGPLASNILGLTDVDGNGISGIELTKNAELLKESEATSVTRDGKGHPSYIESSNSKTDPKIGISVTLDRRIQNIVEDEIQQALEESGAKSVLAIVMDPFSGEIYGMGQRPSFDPNSPKGVPTQNLNNQWVNSLYEPGSTMKAILAAVAINDKILTKNFTIDCGRGKITIGNVTIREAESDHQYESLSLEKVVRYSSNIGAIRIAQALGQKRIQEGLKRFGLTQKTDVGLPGELNSQIKWDELSNPVNLATAGFGQGISFTPLQMVNAFATFANGGYAVKPRLFPKETTPSDKLERVISPETANAMKEILVSVTEDTKGTGRLAQIKSIRVAGKTGTAQKYEPGAGYKGGKYFTSFIGFLPADAPQLVIGVMLDEPQKRYYASEIAAPLFRKIAERSLPLLNRNPSLVVTTKTTPPALPAPTKTANNDSPTPSTPMVSSEVMPDLKGLTMSETLRVLSHRLDTLKMAGNGYLKTQDPAPGSPLPPQTEIRLTFAPEP